MSKDLEYFKDFLENPASYKIHQFYSLLNEFGNYVIEHKDDFNYLKDKEWRKIRKRLVAAVRIKDALKEEFEALEFKLNFVLEKGLDKDKITVYKEWLEFLKRNQTEYDISDKDIEETEEDFKKLVVAQSKESC